MHVKNGHFEQNGKKISFIGANFWYGAILASDGQGGDKERLIAELDTLKGLGITNLRVLVGGDGPDGIPTRIEPTLQKTPGEYNDTILRGLDYLLVEMAKRDMKAVLYLNNTWEWSGGFGCYLEWAGAGKALIPAIDGYQPFKEQMSGFSTNEKAQELFYQHIRNIVSRKNSITGKPYKDDATIFSWQIANEPRCFSADTIVRQKFVEWIGKAASIIKECDPNHMVSAGSEGYMGCEQNWELFEKVHSHPQIDYITIHIWPYNWSWAPAPNPEDYIWTSIDSTKKYLAGHAAIAER
ncbi:MAG: beta-mannosidase, partial [Clostridiales bacterium]|nr:beta-mannosidase [Clostridiales bacterium]